MTEVTQTNPTDADSGESWSQSISPLTSSESDDKQNNSTIETNKTTPEKCTETAILDDEIKMDDTNVPIDYIDQTEEILIDLNSEEITKPENGVASLSDLTDDPQNTECSDSDKAEKKNDLSSKSEFGQGDGHARASTSTAQPPSPVLSVYHVKWIKWKDNKTAIITQNENGPCPLIAIMNVLILKGKVQLPSMVEMITASQLIEYLGDTIFHYAPQNISEDNQLNYEQNMHDAIAVFPKLQTGLDVNVKFTGVSDFEYTPECIVFDLLNIQLYHGWLVDPQKEDEVVAVANMSYNQLVEKIITDKASTNSDVVTKALIAESFLERSASQLTYHGLCELNATLKQDELGVLFRNNHFSMIYKHKNELFQLVTDQGFLTESNVVWETLSNIDGDGQFVDSHFVTVPPKTSSCTMLPATLVPSDQQIDQDYLVALSLQEEQRRLEEQEAAWNEYKEKQLGVCDTVTDEELARRLQLEERELQSDGATRRPTPRVAASTTTERPVEPKKKSDCIIL